MLLAVRYSIDRTDFETMLLFPLRMNGVLTISRTIQPCIKKKSHGKKINKIQYHLCALTLHSPNKINIYLACNLCIGKNNT